MAGGSANLKPFAKGVSGNPAGRRKVSEDVKEFAKAHSLDAIKKVYDVMRKSDDDRVVLAAAQTILDRGYGRPGQATDPDDVGKAGVTIQIVQMPAPERQPAKVIEHDGRDDPVAEQVAPPTVSVRPLELSAIRGQESGSGMSPPLGQG